MPQVQDPKVVLDMGEPEPMGVYVPQARDNTGSSEVEEEEPEWREVTPRTFMLVLPTNTEEELVAGSAVSVNTATRFTESFGSKYRLPVLRLVAYPIEWKSASEVFLDSKDELTSFCSLAEKAILPAYIAVTDQAV